MAAQAGAVEAGADVHRRLQGAGREGLTVPPSQAAVHVDPDPVAVVRAGQVKPAVLFDVPADGALAVLGTLHQGEPDRVLAEAEPVVLAQRAAAVLRQYGLPGYDGRVHPAGHRDRIGESQHLRVRDLHVVIHPVEAEGVSLIQCHVLGPVNGALEAVARSISGHKAGPLIEPVVRHEALLLRRDASAEGEEDQQYLRSHFDTRISATQKRAIPPTHPGEMLREDFLPDYAQTVTSLAEALGVSRQTINELLRERRAISPIMALKLARLFGNSPEFWMKAQHKRDLWESEQRHQGELADIEPLAIP